MCYGVDERGIETSRMRKSVGVERTFSEDINDFLVLSDILQTRLLPELLKQLITQSREKLIAVPERPVCQELATIGIFDYRQLNLLAHYKVLYRIDRTSAQNTRAFENDTVLEKDTALENTKARGSQIFIIAFMRQKQSAQKLLVDMMLLA